MSEETARTPRTFYEAVGGEETFTRLLRRFYQEVAADPVLRPVYPAQDLGPAEEHLALFLIQYWGGPRTYDELRGHPRLRMRHARFTIGETERDLVQTIGRLAEGRTVVLVAHRPALIGMADRVLSLTPAVEVAA